MVEISIKIPEDLKKQIDESKLDVSNVVIDSLTDELAKILALKIIASKSKLSEEDALRLGRKIKSGRFKELKKRGLL